MKYAVLEAQVEQPAPTNLSEDVRSDLVLVKRELDFVVVRVVVGGFFLALILFLFAPLLLVHYHRSAVQLHLFLVAFPTDVLQRVFVSLARRQLAVDMEGLRGGSKVEMGGGGGRKPERK